MKIKYEITEMRGLGSSYSTLCPYSEQGRYTHETIRVGSQVCQRCDYHISMNENYVKCKYEKICSHSTKKEAK